MSNNSNTIELFLTNAQYKKLENHQPFQVSYQQLNQDRPADHHVEIELPKPELTKLNRNLRNGKGFRFNPNKIIGGGLLSSGLSLLKTAAKSKAVQNLGKQALSKGLQLAGNSNNSLISSAATLAGNAVNGSGIFDTGLSLLKNAAKSKTVQNLGKQALNKGLSLAGNSNNGFISEANTLKGVTGGKLVKGSQAAKEHMARIRAMRKTGAGFGSFLNSVKKIAKNPILKQIGNVALKTALPIALNVAGNTPAGMLAQGVLQSQGISTGGKISKRNISMPELIANSYVRNPNPLIVRGGSFRAL
jgi:hypothetical protein